MKYLELSYKIFGKMQGNFSFALYIDFNNIVGDKDNQSSLQISEKKSPMKIYETPHILLQFYFSKNKDRFNIQNDLNNV